MTSIVDLVVAHIVAKWDPAITPVPKIASLINMPAEKQLGESILVEPLGHRVDEVNEVYGNEYDTLGIRIYTNQSDTRLMNFGNEIERIFANYVVGGFTRSRITGTTDVSERQRKSFLQIKTLELTRLGVYRGEPIMGVAPTDPSWRDPTYVTIADESAELANSVRHLNITEAEKHTPKIHELGGDRHTQTSPLTLSQAVTFQSDVVMQGNLTVQGTQTIVDTTELHVEDNIIEVNKGEGGAGVTEGFAGIQVDRGSLDDVQILWNESNNGFIFRDVTGTRKKIDVDCLLISGLETISCIRVGMFASLEIGGTQVISSGQIANFDSLKIDGTEVISSGRVLNNIVDAVIGTTKIMTNYPGASDIAIRASAKLMPSATESVFIAANAYWDGSIWTCMNINYYPSLLIIRGSDNNWIADLYTGAKANPTEFSERFKFNRDGNAYADTAWLTFSAKIPSAIRDVLSQLAAEAERPNAPRDTSSGHLICDTCGADLSTQEGKCEHEAAFAEKFAHNPDKVSRLTAKALMHLIEKLISRGVIKNEDLS